jgi:hypothetical protein
VHPVLCVTATDCPATVSDPDRAGPAFAATLNATEPVPVPLAPDVTVIHESLRTAVQPQPLGAVTEIGGPLPAAAPTDAVVGVTVIAQVPAWETVTVWPATLMVPLRSGPAFAATLNATEPGPVPPAGGVTKIHGALLTAVQPHPLGAVTEIGGPLPAADPTDAVVVLRVIEQLPAWETVTVWPATLMVPLRAAPPFAATLKVTTPEPLEVGGDTRVIQGAALVVAQLHPADAVTLIDKLLAPPAGAVTVEELSVNAQVGAAAWVIVSVAEPTVTVPIREAPVLAPTTKVTVPAPLPAEAVTAIHDALLTADHAHPVVTATDPGPPAAGIDCADGFSA